MKLNGHSNIEYNLPSSKPSNAKALIYGTLYDNTNKFWELEEGDTPSVLINAIEIDWNGAKPGMGEGTNGITSTGELKKGVYSPMFAKAA